MEVVERCLAGGGRDRPESRTPGRSIRQAPRARRDPRRALLTRIRPIQQPSPVASRAPATVRRVDTSKPAGDDEPQGDRAVGDMLYQFALQAIGRIDSEQTTAADLAPQTWSERVADAQLVVLQAIYRELRHGHDLAAAQTAALTEHTKALTEHAEALTDHADSMGQMRSGMLGHSDSLDRFPRR
jgi:hypothetical protein